MRKATGYVVYNPTTYQIYAFDVNTRKAGNVSLVNCTLDKMEKPNKYSSFNSMYKNILKIAKQNNFYFDSYNAFGCKWYDILFVESNTPARIKRHGILEVE